MYFDVVLTKNGFYIEESKEKPKARDSALVTLKKIEQIVQQDLHYDPISSDKYAKVTQHQLVDLLKSKSSEILKGYQEKESKLNWLFRKIFSKEKEVSLIHRRITTPSLYTISSAVIPGTHNLLSFKDLKNTSELNENQMEQLALQKAQGWGYEGSDTKEASVYIKELFQEVDRLANKRIIPEECIVYEAGLFGWRKIDSEQTLKRFDTFSTSVLFNILSNEELYSPNFQKVRKIFNLKGNREVTENHTPPSDEPTIKNGIQALILSTEIGDAGVFKLLLRHGANLNLPREKQYSLLHIAAYVGHADIVEILIDKVEIDKSCQGHTALAYACGYQYSSSIPMNLCFANDFWGSNLLKKTFSIDNRQVVHHYNDKVVKLLLENGADPNMVDSSMVDSRGVVHSRGITPLHCAAEKGQATIVQLLLDYGANVNAQNYDGTTPLYCACNGGNEALNSIDSEVIALLLNRGADSIQTTQILLQYARDQQYAFREKMRELH